MWLLGACGELLRAEGGCVRLVAVMADRDRPVVRFTPSRANASLGRSERSSIVPVAAGRGEKPGASQPEPMAFGCFGWPCAGEVCRHKLVDSSTVETLSQFSLAAPLCRFERCHAARTWIQLHIAFVGHAKRSLSNGTETHVNLARSGAQNAHKGHS